MRNKRDNLESLLSLAKASGTQDDINFVVAQLSELDARAEKAKAKRETHNAASDALSDTIANIIDNDYWTIEDILEALHDPEVTQGKVVYRANALVEDGILEKGTVKINKRNLVAYKHK